MEMSLNVKLDVSTKRREVNDGVFEMHANIFKITGKEKAPTAKVWAMCIFGI